MIPALIPLCCALVTGAIVWLGLLWLGSRLRIRRRQSWIKGLFGLATVMLLFVPFQGLPLWNRAFSFYPNPSLPMLGLLGAALWQRLLGMELLKPADWRATWRFGAVGGSLLYLHPLLAGGIDLYYWGWERDTAPWVLAALAVGMLAYGNRLGLLLLIALVGYGIQALESRNCWDYAMDPFYWIFSLVMVGKGIRGRLAGWWQGAARQRQSERVFLPGPVPSGAGPAIATDARTPAQSRI